MQKEPVYAFKPILQDNKWLWQFLHSLLMLLSFCFLLPLGSLLARHKWLFGRDPLSVSVCEASMHCHGGPQCSNHKHATTGQQHTSRQARRQVCPQKKPVC